MRIATNISTGTAFRSSENAPRASSTLAPATCLAGLGGKVTAAAMAAMAFTAPLAASTATASTSGQDSYCGVVTKGNTVAIPLVVQRDKNGPLAWAWENNGTLVLGQEKAGKLLVRGHITPKLKICIDSKTLGYVNSKGEVYFAYKGVKVPVAKSHVQKGKISLTPAPGMKFLIKESSSFPTTLGIPKTAGLLALANFEFPDKNAEMSQLMKKYGWDGSRSSGKERAFAIAKNHLHSRNPELQKEARKVIAALALADVQHALENAGLYTYQRYLEQLSK
jgi:hypothetical protein